MTIPTNQILQGDCLEICKDYMPPEKEKAKSTKQCCSNCRYYVPTNCAKGCDYPLRQKERFNPKESWCPDFSNGQKPGQMGLFEKEHA